MPFISRLISHLKLKSERSSSINYYLLFLSDVRGYNAVVHISGLSFSHIRLVQHFFPALRGFQMDDVKRITRLLFPDYIPQRMRAMAIDSVRLDSPWVFPITSYRKSLQFTSDGGHIAVISKQVLISNKN